MQNKLPSKLSGFADSAALIEQSKFALEYAKDCGATDAIIDIDKGIGLTVNVRNTELETLEFDQSSNFKITAYVGKRKASTTTTLLTEESLKQAISNAVSSAKIMPEDEYAGLAEESMIAQSIPDLKQYAPWDLTIEDAVKIAQETEEQALSYDSKIVNTEGATVASSQDYNIYVNSRGLQCYYPTSQHYIVCNAVAQDEHANMETGSYYTTAVNKNELLAGLTVGKKASKYAMRKLSAKKLKTTQAPVLFVPQAARSLFKHLLEAISGGNIYRKNSFLLDKIDHKIFPDFITLREQPHILGSLYSKAVDADGIATYSKDIIKDGKLLTYLLSVYTARKLKLKTTANASGVNNLLLDIDLPKEKYTYKDLIKKMHKGLIVTDFLGDGVNILTGDYSRGIEGFWVENGQIKHAVSENTIAGNLTDIFNNIVAIGNDIDKRSNIITGSIIVDNMKIAGS